MSFNWTQPQRQPAKALIYVFYKTLITVIKVFTPLLLTLLFKQTTKEDQLWEYVIAIIPAMAFLLAIVQYRFFTFYINSQQQLLVQKGVFTKKQMVLPLEKVQAVNMRQQWLHRLTQLAEVSFDSPGSNTQEVKLTLTSAQAKALKQQVLLFKNTGETVVENNPAEPETTSPPATNRLYDLDPVSLIKLGLTANHMETFLIVLAFGYSLLQNIKNASDDYYKKSMDVLSGYMVYQSVLGVLLLVLLVIAVSIIISFMRIVLQYANFSIVATQQRFQIHTGLINTKEVLVPFSKVQYISWRANWLRTKINMYILQFHSIGQLQLKENQRVTVPLTRPDYLPQLLAPYHPIPGTDSPAIRVHRRYVSRMFTLFIVPLLLLVLVMTRVDTRFLWGLLFPLYHAVRIYLFHKKFALRVTPQALYLQKGSYGRESVLLLWHKIQTVTLVQSIYQRRYGLATVQLQTAGGNISLPYIPLSIANQLTNYALYKTETETWQ